MISYSVQYATNPCYYMGGIPLFAILKSQQRHNS